MQTGENSIIEARIHT